MVLSVQQKYPLPQASWIAKMSYYSLTVILAAQLISQVLMIPEQVSYLYPGVMVMMLSIRLH